MLRSAAFQATAEFVAFPYRLSPTAAKYEYMKITATERFDIYIKKKNVQISSIPLSGSTECEERSVAKHTRNVPQSAERYISTRGTSQPYPRE